jgi:hypothetical protein
MDLPKTLASPGRKQASQNLQPGRVKLVRSESVGQRGQDARISAVSGSVAHRRLTVRR